MFCFVVFCCVVLCCVVCVSNVNIYLDNEILGKMFVLCDKYGRGTVNATEFIVSISTLIQNTIEHKIQRKCSVYTFFCVVLCCVVFLFCMKCGMQLGMSCSRGTTIRN